MLKLQKTKLNQIGHSGRYSLTYVGLKLARRYSYVRRFVCTQSVIFKEPCPTCK
jgi:hypothetical protein